MNVMSEPESLVTLIVGAVFPLELKFPLQVNTVSSDTVSSTRLMVAVLRLEMDPSM